MYNININVPNGIYVFLNQSGLGKSYLAKILQGLQEVELIKCIVLTYCKHWETDDYIKLLRNSDVNLVLCDRYDLYNAEQINNMLRTISKQTVILVDVKSIKNIGEIDGVVDLEFKGEELTIQLC